MRVLLAGATGYIGSAVLKELVAREIDVVALIRPGRVLPADLIGAATVVESDVSSEVDWDARIPPVDAVISCLASRTGAPADAQRVDFDANRRLLERAERDGARHFVLLSAICVQKPRLAFQREKLRFEALLGRTAIPATVVRPTAFFRSLIGQIERVKTGKPFLVFGDGRMTACKPISDRDLAVYVVDQLLQSREGMVIKPIGGPGPALTPRDQAGLLAQALGLPLRVRSLPPAIFDWLRWLITPFGLFSGSMSERAELLRIAKFYATESMLHWDEREQCYDAEKTPEVGSDTLADFYAQVVAGEIAAPERREQGLF